MDIVEVKSPPTGLARSVLRLPIQFYRLRLGWLVGDHLMLLTHTGRISATRRQAVLGIIAGGKQAGSYVACSAFGPRAAWYRNVLTTPEVTIEVGNRRMTATTQPLEPKEGGEVMVSYARSNPVDAPRRCRFMGLRVDRSEADYREVGRHLPFVRFTPRS